MKYPVKAFSARLALRLILFVSILVAPQTVPEVQTQVPVGVVFDNPLLTPNSVVLIAETLMQFLLKKERGFAGLISDVNDFFSIASTLVNGVIKNMQMIRSIVDLNQDIIELYQKTITAINTPLDNGDGTVDDLDYLDKWKEIQILLAIIQQSQSVFELFTALIEDDTLTIDDKGRVQLIHQTYKEMIQIRSALRLHIRRINRNIYAYKKQRREIRSFEALWN